MPNAFMPDPYRSQSGKRKGELIDKAILTEYKELKIYLGMLNNDFRKKYQRGKSRKNDYHKYLAWIIGRAKEKESVIICPHCGENMIRHIALRSVGDHFIQTFSPFVFYCGKPKCRRNALYYSHGGATRKVGFDLFYAKPVMPGKGRLPKTLDESFVNKVLEYYYSIPSSVDEAWATKFWRES